MPKKRSSTPAALDSVQKVSGEYTQQSQDELNRQNRLLEVSLSLLPKFGHQWNLHALATMRRQTLSRILYYNSLYQKIVDIPGVICEFGVQWGATLAQLINFRGMYEPYNHSRKIFGFDTFEGFQALDEKDGLLLKAGDYSTMVDYQPILEEILAIHESFSPIPHVRKFELIKGNASDTIDTWLEANPHAIVAMAIFDMDVYKPTRDVLQKVLPRLTKGSLLVFDELSCQHFPGETAAVAEVLGLNNISLRRHPHQPYCAWAVYGD